MVDFLRKANGLVPNLLLTSPSNESNVKPSITLLIWDVRDIGRKSSSMDPGGDTLGMGMTKARFNCCEKFPCTIEAL